MRCSPRSATACPACGLPWVSSTTICTGTRPFCASQLRARTPTTRLDGHSVVVRPTVWRSPFGSSKLTSVTSSAGTLSACTLAGSATLAVAAPCASVFTGWRSASTCSRTLLTDSPVSALRVSCGVKL